MKTTSELKDTTKNNNENENEILFKMLNCFKSLDDDSSSSLSSIQISNGIHINYNYNIGFHVLSSLDFIKGQVAAVIPKEVFTGCLVLCVSSTNT